MFGLTSPGGWSLRCLRVSPTPARLSRCSSRIPAGFVIRVSHHTFVSVTPASGRPPGARVDAAGSQEPTGHHTPRPPPRWRSPAASSCPENTYWTKTREGGSAGPTGLEAEA